MIVFRIAKAAYAQDLSGFGSKKYGGRWNYKGIPVLYTSTHAAMALLELLVHLPVAYVASDYQLIKINCPNESIDSLNLEDLPSNWKEDEQKMLLKDLGKDWIMKSEKLCFSVPSAILPGEQNVLINPSHQLFSKVKIESMEPIPIDRRLK